MGIISGANLSSDGLVYSLDAANFRSYSGSGLTSNALVGGIGATLVNGVGFTSANGGSFLFDGADDYITLSSNSNITGIQARTLTAWAKFNQTNTSVVCGIGLPDFFQLFEIHAYQNKMTGHRYGSEVIGTTTLSTGVWYHAAFSYDGSTSRIYVNGILENSKDETLNTANTPLTIGKKAYSANSNMNGLVSNVNFYNRALSAQEIKQNYNATKKRYGL